MSLTVDAPKAAPPTASAPVSVPAQPTVAASVFSSDAPNGPDHLGRSADAAFLAELVTHKAAGTPFCIGIMGPAGGGKSAFLNATLDAVRRLSEAADEAGLATPFAGDVAVVSVGVQAGVTPAVSLMQQVFAALAPAHPKLAAEASHAGLDPRAAAREAGERLNETRHRLDTERRNLDDLSGRQARLTEAVLFDTAGSRVDAYARVNRARIDRSLRRFGLAGDTTATFKELVRDASEPGGTLAQKSGWVRAFWAYRGQTRLIVIALVFFALAWGLGALIGNEDALIDAVRSSNEKLGSTADWMTAHAGWLEPLKQVVEIAGLVALAMNLVRGIRFLQPVIKGASLLRRDVETRRRDIDSLLAHQTRRVDTLVSEADLASQHASDAETRLAARDAPGLPLVAPAPGGGNDADAARMFFATLASAIQAGTIDRLPSSASTVPARLVIGIDGFDAVGSEAAADYLKTARGLLDHAGVVTVIAADREHLANGLADTDPALAASRLDRLIQIPYGIGGDERGSGPGRFVQALLKSAPVVASAAVDAPDATHSALDMPWLQSEGAVLEALAPFAGTTPRALKRFVNLYRIARADPRMRGGNARDLAALALGLAAQQAGSPPIDPAAPAPYPGLDETFQSARKAAATALGAPLEPKENARGFATARRYDARG